MSASQKLDRAGVPSGAGSPDSGGGVGAALTPGSVLLGYLIVPMAMSGTSVALPRIAADLGGSGGALRRSAAVRRGRQRPARPACSGSAPTSSTCTTSPVRR
ncbi:hypothetical protein [Streptomyces chartreusis]